MRKKFIYATVLPLDKNNYQGFGIKNFIERDWDIEYWVLFEKLSSVFEEENLFYKKEKNFFAFKSILEVIKRIINLEKKNFYYLNIGLPWYVEVLMKIKGGKKIIMDTFNYPEVYNVVLQLV